MVTALTSVLMLGCLIIVHELGHFLVARWSGVRVVRFSIGFGPRLVRWTRGETECVVSAIPLGGYVKMAGEQRSEHAHQPWEYLSKPAGTRALIVFAGPFVNYLVALLTLWVVFLIGFPELTPVVGRLLEGMPAKAAGLQAGDRIRGVEEGPIETWDEMTKVIHASPGRPLAFRIERDGMLTTILVTPQAKEIVDPFGRPQRVGLIGIAPSGEFQARRAGPIEAAARTIRQQNEWIGQTLLALWSMIAGRISMRESVTGPIGIVYLTSEAVQAGLSPLLYLMSLFSLSLAIFNLFPIPILDGGHLFFILLERLRGRPVSVNIQERSAQVSLVLLVTLVLFICINDVNRFGLLDKVLEWIR